MTWSKLRIIRCMSFPIVLDSCWQSVPSLLLKSPTAAESKKEISCINDRIRINKLSSISPKREPLKWKHKFQFDTGWKFTISTWIRRTPYRVSLRRFTCKEAISRIITLVKQALQLLLKLSCNKRGDQLFLKSRNQVWMHISWE